MEAIRLVAREHGRNSVANSINSAHTAIFDFKNITTISHTPISYGTLAKAISYAIVGPNIAIYGHIAV